MNDRTLGPYTLHSRLGKGGMGEVYRAVDKRTSRLVAVKLLSPSLAGEGALVARFAQEQAVLAALDHPNIVKALSPLEQHDGTWCFAMEYIPSINLAMLIRGMGRLSAENTACVAAQVLSALSFAHGKGIIHRDIKPGNLLVDRDGRVHVTDFGLARSEDLTRLTMSGQVMGTPEYMSPEQAEGTSPDPRSDLYSLGVVLYEALHGEVPFKGNHPLAVLKMHAEAPLPTSVHVTPAFEPILARALAKTSEGRYVDAAAMREAVLAAYPGAESRSLDVTGFPLEAVTAETAPELPRLRNMGVIATILTLVFLGGLGAWVWLGTTKRTPPKPPTRSAVVIVDGKEHDGEVVEIRDERILFREKDGREQAWEIDQVERITYR